jgi:hypothetical protein
LGFTSLISLRYVGLNAIFWSWVPHERPEIVQPLSSFSAFYATPRFITMFTRALHLYLSWAPPIKSTKLSPISKGPS